MQKHQLLVDGAISCDQNQPVHQLDRFQESLLLCTLHMDPGTPRPLQDKQDPKSLHQEFHGDVENNTKGQLQAKGEALSTLLFHRGLNHHHDRLQRLTVDTKYKMDLYMDHINMCAEPHITQFLCWAVGLDVPA